MPKTIYLTAAEPLSDNVVPVQVNIVHKLPEFENLDAAKEFYKTKRSP